MASKTKSVWQIVIEKKHDSYDILSRYFATNIITARIRRMTEGNVFTLSTILGGGYPIPGLGRRGYPIPGPGRGVPHHRSREGERVPHPRSGWGTPPTRSESVTPPPGPGMGSP